MNIYSIKNKGVAGNIWKFAILYITNKRPYMTFLSIFLLTFPDTTTKTIGFLTLVGQIFGFLFEIPSGYISDRFGHKNALVIAKTFYLFSTMCYIFGDSKIYFYIGAIFFAFGISMLSGTTSAFLKETLEYLNIGNNYSQISGRLRSFGFAIPVALILIVSFVAEFNYRLAFGFVGIIDIIGLITTISLVRIQKEFSIDEFDYKNIQLILKEYFSFGWVPYIIAVEGLMGITFGSTIGFKNPFQESIGLSIGLIGILWAVSRLSISGILLLSGWLKKNLNFKKFILLQGSIFIFSLFLVGISSNKWLVAFGFIIMTVCMWGFSSVKDHFYLEYIHQSKNRVTMLSINAFFQKIIVGISGLVMGYLVSIYQYAYSYIIIGSIVAIFSLLALIFLKNKKQPE